VNADERAAAVAALVHRMNGALNNASMALEIALADAASVDAASDKTLRTGLAAMAQASRAATLLASLVHGRVAPDDRDADYARDVQEILREYARSSGVALDDQHAIPVGGGAAHAADALVAGLARLRARR
jgi:hypothetical protein